MTAGIDYGMGTSNIDLATGIRYGVISQNSIMGEALDDMDPIYGGPNCPCCGGDVVESVDMTADMEEWRHSFGSRDYACEACEKVFDSFQCFSDEATGLEYEDGKYSIIDCLDSDLMVLRSPYYTHAQFCSPCVPGAGNLDNPVEEGVRTYCLGHEWFNGETPYPVFRVVDGTLVDCPTE